MPKHVLLNPDEVTEILSKYRIKNYQLPHVKASDPAVKEIGAKPGDIVKISRRSPTSGDAISYRYVVMG